MDTNTNSPATVEAEEVDHLVLAAQPCPEEYRAAYTHLLRQLWIDATGDRQEPETPRAVVMFKHEILLAISRTPELDPIRLADVFDTMTDYMPEWERSFSERLRMLSHLRHR